MRGKAARLSVALLWLGAGACTEPEPAREPAEAAEVQGRVSSSAERGPLAAPLPPATAAVAPAVDRDHAGAQPPPVADARRTAFAGTTLQQDTLLAVLRDAEPLRFKPVGSTSTVFRVALDAPHEMAFKSQTRERPRGPVAEVAAYRVARCLGLDSVPPATLRKLPLERLDRGLVPEDRSQWEAIRRRLVTDVQDQVLGAAIYWVPSLHDVGIDTGPGIRQWSEWLTLGGQIPVESRALMAHLSTMLLFDYLIANWDRFSGGNAKGDAEARRLYLRDHDSAFAPSVPATVQRRVLDRMLRAQRFSRSFYRALVELTPMQLNACLAGEQAAEAPLLSSVQVDALLDRRQTVISHVASLIELHGVDRVLVFP